MDINETLIQNAKVIHIGPGCIRRDLPNFNGCRAWIVEIEAGYSWPYPDQHDQHGEMVLVISGDLVEGEKAYGPGSYLIYGPNSVHTPSTKAGVRLFGLNVA